MVNEPRLSGLFLIFNIFNLHKDNIKTCIIKANSGIWKEKYKLRVYKVLNIIRIDKKYFDNKDFRSRDQPTG